MTGVVATSTLHARLAAVVAQVLRVPIHLVEADASFTALGMDSLAAVELTAAIEDELDVSLPLSAVHECPTIADLVRFIELGLVPREDCRAMMRADAILPPEIMPDRSLLIGTLATSQARRILLTGATGFVGAFLLRALLDETAADIYCLVRGEDDPSERVRANLRRYDLWADALASKIHVVAGDIAAPRLGLSLHEFARLASEVDVIYHAAADVDWVSAYQALREPNVLGTVELLRLACSGTAKPVHFLSSVSVCHSTHASRSVDEDADPMTTIDGLWMGYAQSKCVAEALVREAGARGLPVTIIRPALVTGDRTGGRSNPSDLVSRFIAGCIAMRAAPDLDWRMDCVPVDEVATAVVRLSHAHRSGVATSHVTAVKPRHWRECVLWMRLAGYDIDLVPYREWTATLRETDAGNPLYPLRPFFLRTVAGEEHLTLPELFEEPRRAQVSNARTNERLRTLGAVSRPLDTRLLSRYFDDFERHAIVPRLARPRGETRGTDELSLAHVLPTIAASLANWLGDDSLTIDPTAIHPIETDDSIIAELTAWRGASTAGLYCAELRVSGCRTPAQTIECFVKSKPSGQEVVDVAECVATLASPALGAAVRRFRDDLGFTSSHLRELALYADADDRLRRHMPRVLATHRDDANRQWLIVLESLSSTELATTHVPASPWTPDAIDAAVTGLACIHAAGIERFEELSSAVWQAPARDTCRRAEMTPLWAALATHAFEHAPAWGDRRLRAVHERLVAHTSAWSSALDAGVRSLIHNDFNPRNIVTRRVDGARSLCAFDWELATIGAPQRDLAELLAFVLPADAPQTTIAQWIERHRVLLEHESGTRIRRDEWDTGFRAALADVLVDRLASYAMVDRIRRQSFLPSVVRGWTNLNRYYGWLG